MKSSVRAEVHEERARAESQSHDELWKFSGERFGRQRWQDTADDGDGRIELTVDLVARPRSTAELRFAIPDVPRASKDGADEVLKVAGQMKREVGGRVGDTRRGLPDGVVVWKACELAFEAFQLAHEGAREVAGYLEHRRLTSSRSA